MKRMTLTQISTFLTILVLLSVSDLQANCQIPCGIYGDEMRIMLLKEHVQTMEKSMKMIQELSQDGQKNYNQLVRWINNKEHHAREIQNIVDAYFLTQRVKPVSEDKKAEFQAYSQKVVTLHQMLVYAMKAKQSTDLEHCVKLNQLIDTFSGQYFSAEDLEHLKGHK